MQKKYWMRYILVNFHLPNLSPQLGASFKALSNGKITALQETGDKGQGDKGTVG